MLSRQTVHRLTPRRKSDARRGAKAGLMTPTTSKLSPQQAPLSSSKPSASNNDHDEPAKVTPPRQSSSDATTKMAAGAKLYDIDDDERSNEVAAVSPDKNGDDNNDAGNNANSSDDSLSSSSDSADSESDDESTHSTSKNTTAITPSSTTTAAASSTLSRLDRDAIIASLPSHINVTGLSDYEILRLRNIQRNEAKLVSLGLFGITSSANPNNAGVASSAVGRRKEAARKAADTRRRNNERAREAVERHERWERDAGIKPRSQPSRAAKKQEMSPYATPPKRIQQFNTRLSELKQFYTTHGHYRITRTFEGGNYRPLCDWVSRVRTQYAKYRRGEKSTLDGERVGLLESLDGEWWRKGEAGRGGAVRGSGMRGSRRAAGNIARRLWKSESETDEEGSILERMKREVDDESTEEEEVEIGSLDSYSEEESYDDGYDFERRRPRRRTVSASKKRGRKRSRRAAATSTMTMNKGRQVAVSSLEQIDGPPAAATRSSRKRARGNSNQQYHHSRRREHSSRRDFYSDMEIGEDDLVSEREERFERRHNGGSRNRRKRTTHTTRQHRHHQYSSSQREKRSITRRIKKPMNEIIVAATPALDTLDTYKWQNQLQCRRNEERDQLMAEYGRLYGRRCWVFERKARLEYELRAIQSFVANVSGNSGSLLTATGAEASTAVVLAGLP